MAGLGIHLQWRRDRGGYKLVERVVLTEVARTKKSDPPKSVPIGDQFIVGRTGDLEDFNSLRSFDGLLYGEFAKVIDSQSALAFVNRFAPLTNDGLRIEAGDKCLLAGDSVSRIIREAGRMRRFLEAYSRKAPRRLMELIGSPGIALGKLDIALIPNFKSRRFELRSVPEDLLTLIWVQFGQAVVGGLKLATCEQCGVLFEAGPGTGRRLDAKFCSDQHRVDFNSLKRSRSD